MHSDIVSLGEGNTMEKIKYNSDEKPKAKMSINFGLRGWLLCLYCCVGFMTLGGAFWSAIAQNTMASVMAEQLGTTNANVLAINSYIGYGAIVILLFVGIAFGKYKTRIVQSVALLCCGVALFFYGRATTIVGYIVAYLVIDIVGNATSSMGLPQIAAEYFPTKKGSFLGIATIGATLASAVTLTILNSLVNAGGAKLATAIFAGFTILMGILNWIFIPSDPAKVGFLPDNGDFSKEALEAHQRMMAGPPIWTVKEAVRDKNFWLLPIAYGLLFMVSNGVTSQLVPYQIEQMKTIAASNLFATGQFENMGAAIGAAMADGSIAKTAQSYMQLVPIFAIPGSIVSGIIDQKIGTRKAGMLMAAFYVISCVFGGLMPYNSFTNWVFMGLFFFWSGANANLVMSHAISCFGPRDYPVLWGYMSPIMHIFRVAAPLVLSLFLSIASTSLIGYRTSYTVFAGASLVALVLIFFSNQNMIKKPGEPATAYTK